MQATVALRCSDATAERGNGHATVCRSIWWLSRFCADPKLHSACWTPTQEYAALDDSSQCSEYLRVVESSCRVSLEWWCCSSPIWKCPTPKHPKPVDSLEMDYNLGPAPHLHKSQQKQLDWCPKGILLESEFDAVIPVCLSCDATSASSPANNFDALYSCKCPLSQPAAMMPQVFDWFRNGLHTIFWNLQDAVELRR